MNRDRINAFWLASQYISTILISFITLKLNIDHFGSEQYGVWIILASLFGIGSSLDMGLGIGIIKFISASNKRKNYEEISSYFSIGLVLFLVLGVLIVVGILIIGNIFYLNTEIIPYRYKDTGQKVFLFLSFNFLLGFISNVFRSIFEGSDNFIITSKLSIIYDWMIFLSVILVIILNLGLDSLAFYFVVASFLRLFFYYYILKKDYKQIKFSFAKITLNELIQLLKFSVNVQFSTVVSAMIDPLTKYLIGIHSNLNIISIYEIGRRFALSISGLYTNVFRIVLPKASVLISKEESRLFVSNEIVKYTKIGITYSGFAFGICSLLIAFIIKFWFKSDEAIVIFLILAFAESINIFGYSIYIFIIGIGKASFLAFLQVINVIMVFISLTIGFTIFQSYLALYGYAFSVLIGNFLMLMLLSRNYAIPMRRLLISFKLYKLVILFGMLFLLTILIYMNFLNMFILLGILSFFSIVFFFKDIIFLATILKPSFLKLN